MSRELSTTADAAIYAPSTNEVFVRLLEISHPSWSQPFRFCDNTEDVVSNGDTYVRFPFTIEPPNDSGEDPARATLLLDNIERSVLPSIRQVISSSDRITVTLAIVLVSEPDTVLGDVWEFELTEYSANAQVIQCNLLLDAVLDESVPGDDMTPAKNPGLFKEGE